MPYPLGHGAAVCASAFVLQCLFCASCACACLRGRAYLFPSLPLQDPIPRKKESESPATRNRTRDHLIAAVIYSQMLYQLSYSRRV
jgi:hypothetical protein